MDGRDAFLTLARDKHYEFSSLRRAQFSTMCMLYELHNQGQDKFVYTCNNCKNHVETRYHCTVCDVSRHTPHFIINFFLHLLTFLIFFFFVLPFRTTTCVSRAKRKSVIHTKWSVSASTWTTDHRQQTDVLNRTHKKRESNPFRDVFSHWCTRVNVAMQIVVYRRVRR